MGVKNKQLEASQFCISFRKLQARGTTVVLEYFKKTYLNVLLCLRVFQEDVFIKHVGGESIYLSIEVCITLM